MKSKFFLLLPLLAYVVAMGCIRGDSDPMSFNLSTANHVEVDSLGPHEYRVVTNGVDPYISLMGLKRALREKQTVLTFEYTAPEGVNFLELFFLLSSGTGSFGGNVAGMQKFPGLEATGGFTVYSVDLSEAIENFNWDSAADWIRLDFGDRPGVEFVIRDIRFRERNAEEEALYREKEDFKNQDRAANDQIANYLSTTYSSFVTRVEVLDSVVRVEGNYASGDQKAMICAVKPWDDITQPEQFQGAALPPSPFSIEMERYVNIDGFQYDHALSRWTITKDGELLSSARYADYIKPERNMPKGILKGRKGIGGYHVKRGHRSDLVELPVTSITVNIGITRMMYLEEQENTIPHEYGGKTYYFNADAVEGFDQTMLEAFKHDIVVAAIILVNPAHQSADPLVGQLLEDEHFEAEGAFYTMPNMSSIESVQCYAAALDFLANRYNREDNRHGRIHHWIMHNEVDAGNVWTNMGHGRPLHVFLDAYHRSMRLCYNIARNYDENSEVFASFTHSWADPVPVDGDYATLDLLNGLLQYSAVEGDFQWGLACHPYPEDLNEPKTWNDQAATFSMNSPMVTFKNLEVLDKWAKIPENSYKGESKRTVWLSENGTNSRSYSEQDLAEQAAGFAYAWKKMKELDGIDAFQWHNWMDGRGEFGLRIGLRKYPDDETDPAGRKPVWFLYQAADTPKEDKVFEPYKSIIGISDWSEIMREVE